MRKWRGCGLKASEVLFLILLSILSLCVVNTQLVKSQSSGIIYINIDGSVSSSDNSTVPIQRVGDVYTFNGSIIGYSIVVQRENIIVNGSGYTLQGTGGIGIDLSSISNVTIRNVQISGFEYGIYVSGSLNNNITENNIANAMYGIMIQNASNNNIISANNVTNCASGISIFSSSNNKLRNNILKNGYNFAVYGAELSHFVNDVDISNIINGKKVYYLVKQSDVVISPSTFPDLGFLALVNCTRMTVQNLELANNGQGAVLAFTTGSAITQNYITNNSIGVGLYSSSGNIISGNNIRKNDRGIQVSKSSKSNSISANNITNNSNGIYLFESSQNTVNGNNITNSDMGIGFRASSSNMIYHNNFISNTRQVYDSHMDDSSVTPSVNFWDFGYPPGGLGGNYWSDYTGLDVKNGPNQDKSGSDGIGDTPYVIYENNKDNYPLMAYSNVPVIHYPEISVVSPENKTYTVNNVSLTFAVSEPNCTIAYSLDGQANVTIAGNTTLAGLSDGSHSLAVYAKDTDGNTGTSETIYFSIKTQQSEPFPLTWIVAATAIIAIGVVAAILVYFKKIKKPTRKVKK
jgi:parallel beta-helix repeat protein